MIPEEEEKQKSKPAWTWKNVPAQPRFLARDYEVYLKKHLKMKDHSQGHSPSLAHLPELSQVIQKLKEDLRASKSFVGEFVADPHDGAGLLLELLRAVVHHAPIETAHQRTLRRIQADEFELLTCLSLTTSSERALKRLVEHTSGLCTVASCILSSQVRSRLLALELLTKACELAPHGYAKVLEAMSAARLVFGEAVRFKILVSLIHSSTGTGADFELAALRFLNTILRRCPRPDHRIRVQSELEEAGFDIRALEAKLHEKGVSSEDPVWGEVDRWKEHFLDVQKVMQQKRNLEEDFANLHREVDMLRKALKKLEEDKISLMQIERELQERCAELDQELIKYRPSLTRDIKKKPPSPAASDSGTYSVDHATFEESGQTEEIWIDIPTIRPPEAFRSNLDEPEPEKVPSKDLGLPPPPPPAVTAAPKTSGGSDRDSALSESDSSDGNVDPPWQCLRSRSADRLATINVSALRSKSEDRLAEPIDDKKRKAKNSPISTTDGFHMKAHPGRLESKSSSRLADIKPTRVPSIADKGKHFPLPRTCKSNFIARGHSNCGRYSGPVVPPPDYRQDYVKDPVSALVHREITEAVRDIGGWL